MEGTNSQNPPTTNIPLTMEQLQDQIQVLQQTLNNLTIQPRSSPRGLKVAPPDTFDGTLSTTETFLSQLALYFEGKKHELQADSDKITFALSYMKGGTAGPWAKRKVKEFVTSPSAIQTWEEFAEEFFSVFGDPDLAGTAREKMEHLKQGSQTAEEYVAKFREIKDDTGYNDAALVDRFEKGLNSALVDKIYALPEMPNTLNHWIEWATKLDRQWRKREVRKKAVATSAVSKQLKPLTPANIISSKPSTVPQLPQVVPMEVDAGKKNFKSIVCYKCRKTGHIARNCTSTVNINSMDFEALKTYMKEEIAKEETSQVEGFQ